MKLSRNHDLSMLPNIAARNKLTQDRWLPLLQLHMGHQPLVSVRIEQQFERRLQLEGWGEVRYRHREEVKG